MAFLSRRHGGLRFAMLLAAALAALTARTAPSEREVQAAFLCSFAEFVDWPETRSATTVDILVLGDDPFGRLLDETVEERPLQTKAIQVRRSRRVEDASHFHLVFISASERSRLDAIFASLEGESILTVSDIPDFAAKGGIIGFVLEDRRVRFEINEAAAQRANLRISSRLLNLARVMPASPRRGP